MMRVLACNSLIVMGFLLIPSLSSATNFDVSHLAAELNRVSAELARDLRNTRGYSSVRFSADRLSREAEQLVRLISRNRSMSSQRSQFQNVVRRYRELEEAFLRSNREHNRYVYNQVGVISNLFSGLNSEFFYTNYVEPAPQRYYYSPPVRGGSAIYSGRSVTGLGTPIRQNKPRTRSNRETIRALLPANNFSHRSSVLERQQRNNATLSRPLSIGGSRATLP